MAQILLNNLAAPKVKILKVKILKAEMHGSHSGAAIVVVAEGRQTYSLKLCGDGLDIVEFRMASLIWSELKCA
jgi:hypothetical protein